MAENSGRFDERCAGPCSKYRERKIFETKHILMFRATPTISCNVCPVRLCSVFCESQHERFVHSLEPGAPILQATFRRVLETPNPTMIVTNETHVTLVEQLVRLTVAAIVSDPEWRRSTVTVSGPPVIELSSPYRTTPCVGDRSARIPAAPPSYAR